MGTDRRKRGWPAPGQIAFAVAFGLVAAVFVGVFTHHAGTNRAATVPTPPTVSLTSAPPVRTTSRLSPLTIAAASHQDTYSRTSDFGTWTDVRGCQDTRATLLIRSSQAAVTFTTARNCTVKTGRWIDPWSGSVTTEASGVQIDHTVPLGNAWAAGAWAWTHAERVAFTNDLTETDDLVAILARENEEKGDHGPETWRPPARSAWCRYALDWDHIKASWRLSATTAEWSALVEMTSTC